MTSVERKEIKAAMKQVKEALKLIENAEHVQENARCESDYKKAENESASATLDIMHALEEAIRLTSAIGSTNGLYGVRTCHKVVEYRL